MKNKMVKAIALLGACILTAASLAGCGAAGKDGGTQAGSSQTESSQSAGSQTEGGQSAGDQSEGSQASDGQSGSAQAGSGQTADGQSGSGQQSALSGSVRMVGSTSMEKFANALSEAFMEKYPDVTVTAEFVGSSAGVEAVLSGSADVGNSSRNLKEEEKQGGAVENVVAIDGIAVCVDPANTVTDLTKQQLTDIFTGKITNWSQAGGEDSPVIVIGREAGSGTRGAFEEILGVEDTCSYVNELDSTGAVMAKVASTPGAIGYVSLDALDSSVKAVSLDGTEASPENIKAGSYFLSRPFVMATKGEISAQSELVQEWFNFVMGDEGQSVAADIGLITVE